MKPRLMILITLGICLAACGRKLTAVEGVWITKLKDFNTKSVDSLTLKPDLTYEYKLGGSVSAGTYKIFEDRIELSRSRTPVLVYLREGNRLIPTNRGGSRIGFWWREKSE